MKIGVRSYGPEFRIAGFSIRWISSARIWSVCNLLLLFTIQTCQPFELDDSPYIVTDPVDIMEDGSYQFNGAMINLGANRINQHGFCWSTSANPDLSDELIELEFRNHAGSFYTGIQHLAGNTTFYIRAYLTTNSGTIYGSEQTFRTPMPTIPVLSTSVVLDSTEHIVRSGGEVLFSGGEDILSRGICWSTMQYVSISDSISLDSTGTGIYESIADELTPNTTYYLRAYATNSIGIGYGEIISFTTWEGSVADYDGNTYETIVIGAQTWMAENLMVSNYPDGTPIPFVEDNQEWHELDVIDKAYCWLNNSKLRLETYGALYNWYGAMNGEESSDLNPSGVQGVCPDGWHIPSEAEWTELSDYLGGWNMAGGALKETGNSLWESPNSGATNSSGFAALPGGYRNDYSFSNNGYDAFFQSATQLSGPNAYFIYIRHNSTFLNNGLYTNGKKFGVSVRCVSDQ